MSNLKFLLTSTLIALSLTACKPGVYYPLGNSNVQQTNAAGQVIPAAKPGSEKTSTIIAG